jgi:hypothetical protein
MGVPASEVDYTSATTGKGDHEVHKGHVAELEKKPFLSFYINDLKEIELGRNIVKCSYRALSYQTYEKKPTLCTDLYHPFILCTGCYMFRQ